MTSKKALASPVLVTILTIGPILSASDPATAEKSLRLVAQAVQAEIHGDLLSREKFLGEANQTETNFAPADRLRGQVIGTDGSRVPVDQAKEVMLRCRDRSSNQPFALRFVAKGGPRLVKSNLVNCFSLRRNRHW